MIKLNIRRLAAATAILFVFVWVYLAYVPASRSTRIWRITRIFSGPPSKMIVVGKTVAEETDWIGQELPE